MDPDFHRFHAILDAAADELLRRHPPGRALLLPLEWCEEWLRLQPWDSGEPREWAQRAVDAWEARK